MSKAQVRKLHCPIRTIRHLFTIYVPVVLLAIGIALIGCGEVEDPLTTPTQSDNRVPGILGETKRPETTAAAPQAPGVGIPFVKEVRYYTDWKLTKEVASVVPPGTTLFVKVVFSEPMRHIAAGDKKARPVLYYRVDNTLTRFRVAEHRARGEDFVSGDAKPLGNGTDDFVCKVTVPESGVFTIAVGKRSTDLDRNTLAAFYTHKEKLLVKLVETAVIPATVSETDFIGQVFTPYTGRRRRVNFRMEAEPIAGVIVTIISGSRSGEQIMTNQDGQYIFRGVEKDELHLRVEKGGFELKEVTVHRSEPTQLSNGTTPWVYKDPQYTPGNILIGHRWPDEVRFIFRETKVVNDLLFAISDAPSQWGGLYGAGVALYYSKNVHGASNILGTIAHEIAHARQQAVAPPIPIRRGSNQLTHGHIDSWDDTPEAHAYTEARRKDWRRFGKAKYDTLTGYTSLLENAAEFCAYYWSIGRWDRDNNIHSDLERVAPNRLKWAEEWLTK